MSSSPRHAYTVPRPPPALPNAKPPRAPRGPRTISAAGSLENISQTIRRTSLKQRLPRAAIVSVS
ncbi:hypothetical protein D3P08_08795 [Paenibacillus nanensis]|uniref:Uncharacterized protein n=1 Tax=Paenibacillus nanensis TaxID=393251 RepID=A0A3A1UYD0_9BACL|nr:hypothetical protein D3P08_08795 [Paenibacillus nanensis]